MSSARLHAGYTLATAMRSQVAGVRILLARTLLVFQAAVLATANCRFGDVLGVLAVSLVLLRHGKSFREHGDNGPEQRCVPGDAACGAHLVQVALNGVTQEPQGRKVEPFTAIDCGAA